jgi:hypothetical protein
LAKIHEKLRLDDGVVSVNIQVIQTFKSEY